MTKNVVAIFDDISIARQVVEDLANADFARSSISLITNDSQNQYSHYLDKDYVPKDDAVTAAQGLGFGAVVGALTGILVGVAALMIPGIGLAIVAGPIAAGLAGTIAGAVTGGVVGALVKSGVPEDEAPYYAEGIRRGGTLISVQTSDVIHAKDIMNRHGAINIYERMSMWRQDGWKGFEPVTAENKEAAQSSPVLANDSSRDITVPITPTPLATIPVAPDLALVPDMMAIEPTVLVAEKIPSAETNAPIV